MYRVLIVDDEPLERKAMRKVITERVKELRLIGEATNGEEALEITKAENPDLILMDIKMPKVDGLEATKKIIDSYPGTKIVIITAYNEFNYAQQAIKYGAVDYLLKPVKPDKIVDIFMELITEIEEERLYNQLLSHCYNDSEESIEFHQEFFDREKKLYELVKKGNIQEVESFIDRSLSLIRRKKDYSLVKLKIRIIEYLVSLSRTINQEAEINICHFYFEELLSEATELNTVLQFVNWVKNKLKEVIKKIEDAYDEIDDDVVKSAINYIQKNFNQDLTLEEVAKEVHLNSSYLSHIFKEETGSGFNDYLTEIRLDKAQELLRNSNQNITTIANQVGYKNANYFSQVFKKEFNLTPTEYRKKNN
ncbi:response regulator transcription factor [Sporohalobacter salinus]|uniref:response regulator transcription factor n=1 Tax=Sporohalobacter salinus TaxID=1494606 RepID=UPI0019610C7D|nr:response regulator [Sporohalobacter salinus]MBM7622856.1 two-component system response regulator YesN [Sporohalobacter salinus]